MIFSLIILKTKKLLKIFIPPILLDGYRALRQATGANRGELAGVVHLVGDFASWQEAASHSSGYDAEIILEKTKDALLKVKNGEAAYERDSLLFDRAEYSWPLLAGLAWAAARAEGCLNVLDFGGSLGSTYYQHRAFLSGLREVRWNIVEQPRHVEVGRRYFEDEHLKFYASIEDCLADTHPQVILLSSVLQYIPNPYELLEKLPALPCDALILDRTPFYNGARDWLCVQHVPVQLYQATYPVWIFSKERFLAHLRQHWDVMAEFPSLDELPAPVQAAWQGLIATKRKESQYG